MLLVGAGLGLDDDMAARHVNGDVHRPAVGDQAATEQPLDRVRPAQHREPVAQRMDGGPGEKTVGQLADHRLRSMAEEVLAIGGGARDEPVLVMATRNPTGWIAPRMWIGSRSQLVRSTELDMSFTARAPTRPDRRRRMTQIAGAPREPPRRGSGVRRGAGQGTRSSAAMSPTRKAPRERRSGALREPAGAAALRRGASLRARKGRRAPPRRRRRRRGDSAPPMPRRAPQGRGE